jgi:hypothetical protein
MNTPKVRIGCQYEAFHMVTRTSDGSCSARMPEITQDSAVLQTALLWHPKTVASRLGAALLALVVAGGSAALMRAVFAASPFLFAFMLAAVVGLALIVRFAIAMDRKG